MIAIATAILVALIWFAAFSTVRAHRAAWQARIETTIQSKADLLAGELRRQFLVTDQSLHILELEWERDPASFDFDSWRERVLALTDISLQIMITDEKGIIRQSSRPMLIGVDLEQRDYFQHEKSLAHDDERMFIGSLVQGMRTRIWQINFARRLDNHDGSFGGMISASYDNSAFSNLERELSLGEAGLLLVVAPDGSIRGMGDAAMLSQELNIAGSPVFAAMRHSTRGVWDGASPQDHIDRIAAFAPIPGYGLQVLVGIGRHEAMRVAQEWEMSALAFSTAATLLVLAIAGAILWADQTARRRHALIVRDRAELARTNAQLAATESSERTKAMQLEATLTGMTDGVMMVDSRMRLLAWNAQFPEFTGVPASFLRVGLAMEDILRAQAKAGEFGNVDIEAEVSKRVERLRQGISMGTSERQRPNGRIVEIRRNPLPGGGFVTLYSDITTRRMAEERARRAEALAATGRLTAGIAHDFNNLLATIGANTEMLLQGCVAGSREARRLSIISQAANRGADLIRQLMAFARKQTLAPAPVDLNQALRGISELLRSTLGTNVTGDLRLADDLWPALVDPVQIEHVVLNLAINARDAMPQGGRLTISTSNVSADLQDSPEELPAGHYVMLAVSDTGTGMTEEVSRKAFEPFFTTKPPGRGSGLGLSQVYGVARQSGGAVQIESRPGEGTIVRVFLPRAPDRPRAGGLAMAAASG